MTASTRRTAYAGTALGVVALSCLIQATLGQGQSAGGPEAKVTTSEVIPSDILAGPISPAAGDAHQVRRGQYLVAAGDCISCHMRPGGEPLAGGLGLNTPFGIIYSSNISSDRDTGIGSWTSEQFYGAMHDGKSPQGNLYPAFPYPWFHLATREDDDAILAFLKTTAPVRYTAPANGLHFPLNIRASVKGWNLLYLETTPFRSDPGQSEEWNRGAYLVNGLGHCGGCHTPKTRLGADAKEHAFAGGTLDNWTAPDLTSNAQTGLGSWTTEDIAEYLKTGRNAKAAAGGAMGDVISYSTSYLTDADRHSIAIYLKTLPASAAKEFPKPAADSIERGAAIFSDACTSCHLENGVGQPRYFPPLGHNAVVQQTDSSSITHLILAGTHVGPGQGRPSPLVMPSFAWKLDDQEVADVENYIRNTWGNAGPAVTRDVVTDMRTKLNLSQTRFTANSGDRLQ
jgi:mono/diheme cytochrome c family protein